MWAYLAFFALAGVPALFYTRHVNRMIWAIVWLLCVLFVGLRHDVGGDWGNYLTITQRIGEQSLVESFRQQEFLFSLLTWLSIQAGAGVYGVNVVGAAIVFVGLFSYCKTLRNPWLALAASMPFLVVVAGMSANRQGMAIGVVLFVMSRWGSLGIVRRSAGIAVAALFHTSAAFLLLLSVVELKVSRWKKIALFFLAAAVSLWLIVRSEASFNRYTQIYIAGQSEEVYSPGALLHLSLNLVPALIMLLLRSRWRHVVPNWPLIQQLCWTAIALVLLVPFFSVAVGRISLYLFPISLVFVSTLPQFIQRPEGRALVRTLLVFLLGAVLAIWLKFANTAFTYLPYKNVLSVESFELALPR